MENPTSQLYFLRKGSCVCKENTSVKRDILWYSTRKPCITIYTMKIENTWPYRINAVHDGKALWNSDEYTTTFLHSDWPYFLWHGINAIIKSMKKHTGNDCIHKSSSLVSPLKRIQIQRVH